MRQSTYNTIFGMFFFFLVAVMAVICVVGTVVYTGFFMEHVNSGQLRASLEILLEPQYWKSLLGVFGFGAVIFSFLWVLVDSGWARPKKWLATVSFLFLVYAYFEFMFWLGWVVRV